MRKVSFWFQSLFVLFLLQLNIAYGQLPAQVGSYYNYQSDVAGTADNELLGYSIACEGNQLLVGAPGARSYDGAALLYSFTAANSYSFSTPDLSLSNSYSGEWFGTSLDFVGSVNSSITSGLIVGAPDAISLTGEARLFRRDSVAHLASFTGGAVGEYFGETVRRYSDVGKNSGVISGPDGYEDVIIGSPEYLSMGRVYVYDVENEMELGHWDGAETGSKLGYSIDTLPDLNSDGYPEIVAGSPGTTAGDGRVHILGYDYNGDPEAFEHKVLTPPAGVTQYQFGYKVKNAGDVTGDGIDDLLVGMLDVSVISPGKVALYSGAGLLAGDPHICLIEDVGSAYFGTALSGLADIDPIFGGHEFAIGDPGESTSGYTKNGKVYIFGWDATDQNCVVLGEASGEEEKIEFGHALTSCDVNTDGKSDLIVSALRDDAVQTYTDVGAVAVYLGATPTPIPTAAPTLTPTPMVTPTPTPTVPPTATPAPTSTPTQHPTDAPTVTPSPEYLPPPEDVKPGDLKDEIPEEPVVVTPGEDEPKKKQVKIYLPEIITDSLLSKLYKSAGLRAKKKAKAKYRYKVTVTKIKSRKKYVKKLVTRKNEVTFKKLKPGKYKVRYRIQVVKRKKVVAQTPRSPAVNFSIGNVSKG